MADLTEFLAYARAQPWQWGVWDCCTMPGRWVMANLNPDPIRRWRGRYSTEDEALKFIAEAGGLDRLWTVGMIDAGCPEVDSPRAGDVGIIRLQTPKGENMVGGVFSGSRWNFLVPGNAIARCHADHVKVWRP